MGYENGDLSTILSEFEDLPKADENPKILPEKPLKVKVKWPKSWIQNVVMRQFAANTPTDTLTPFCVENDDLETCKDLEEGLDPEERSKSRDLPANTDAVVPTEVLAPSTFTRDSNATSSPNSRSSVDSLHVSPHPTIFNRCKITISTTASASNTVDFHVCLHLAHIDDFNSTLQTNLIFRHWSLPSRRRIWEIAWYDHYSFWLWLIST